MAQILGNLWAKVLDRNQKFYVFGTGNTGTITMLERRYPPVLLLKTTS